MPWYGAVVWGGDGQREYCCQWGCRRGCWELPKGGLELVRRASSGLPDSSPFATARWELWEEAGLWLSWRARADFRWVSQNAEPLALGPGQQQSAFVVTKLQDGDLMVPHPNQAWLTLEQCGVQRLRPDHLRLLRQLDRWVR